MQELLTFAQGQSFFGIEPNGPLSSLLVQAENDDGDLAEMRDSVVTGMQLTGAQRGEVAGRINVCTIDAAVGGMNRGHR